MKDTKLRVTKFDFSMRQQWDQFVDAHKKGTFFHKISWKNIIEKTFSYQSLYLACYDGQRLTGILPLFYLKSIIAGKALISTPFGVYGGVLANDAESEKKLIHAAKDYAEELDAAYIELRQHFAIQYPDLHIRDNFYCTFIREISDSAEGNLSLLPKEARRLVRRAMANGLKAHFTSDINEFYHIYAASVRNLGTPVFPISLFENIFSEPGVQAEILLIRHQDRAVAGVLSFYYKQTVLPYYGGSLPSKRYLAPNNFMYYSLMNHASEKGISYFDFGRSKVNTGAYHFKRHMGFIPTPLPYQYYLMNGARIPNNNPLNPKFRLAIGIWRRLPLAMTKVIGPKIVKQFP